MKTRLALGFLWVVASAAPAIAASASGEWLVADKTARISVNACNGRLRGVIAWEREHGFDDHNPDPAKRRRPTLGLPVFSAMQQAGPDFWTGRIYNAENGKTYDAKVHLTSPTTLRVEGCVMGFLCGGETWTRVSERKDDCAAPAQSVSAPR